MRSKSKWYHDERGNRRTQAFPNITLSPTARETRHHPHSRTAEETESTCIGMNE